VFPYFTFCGRCPSCTNGYPIGCRHLRMAMLSSANRFPYFVGGFADYFYLPPAHPIIKIPRDLPETVVAGANCALAQICYGFHRAGLVGGKSLVVQGAGGLGLYATALANARGLAPIIVIDAVTSRLELARAFGADIVINLRETTPTERRRLVGEATGGLGADFVVDVTGNPAAIPEGLGMLRVGGKFLEIGSINRGQTVPLDPSRIVFGNKTVMGVSLYELFALVEAVQFLIRYGSRYPFEEMTATTFPLERVNEALQLADGRGAPRVALRMR
jgi:threonine dehydrogenase-like Zn-dependent dehydrogenase